MKFVLAALLGITFAQSTAFAQFTCAEDVECQQSKIEAMAMSDLKTLKDEVRALRSAFLKGATEASEDGPYQGFAKGVNAMDEYLARLDSIEKAPTIENLDELSRIRQDVASIRRAYQDSAN
jgi:hypothetical protein